MNRRLKKKKARQEEIKKAIGQIVAAKKEKENKTADKKTGEKKAAPKVSGANSKKPAMADVARVAIDCSAFSTKAKIHEAFHQEPAFPEYKGNNLDAMYDMLSSIGEQTELTVKNLSTWEAAPESYRTNIRKLLERADRENPKLTVVLD